MTLEELTHIFRFQLIEDDNFKPKPTVDYLLINAHVHWPSTQNASDLAPLLKQLTDHKYVFEGYRDRTPIFIIPEVHVLL